MTPATRTRGHAAPRHAGRALALLLMLAACDVNPFDPAQQPTVSITGASLPTTVTISWQPAGAQLVRVYRGSTAGDGYTSTLVWSIAATTVNSLPSGVVYGTTPSGGRIDVASQALAAGETYTVQVTRQDPKGSGDGFTNTSNRYVGTATFTVATP